MYISALKFVTGAFLMCISNHRAILQVLLFTKFHENIILQKLPHV